MVLTFRAKKLLNIMLKSIITSDTRIKLLMKFFLNPKMKGYLRQLATEFGESTNGIRLELNKLHQAQVLSANHEGRNKIYRANIKHPLFEDIRSIVLKSAGIDQVLNNIIKKLGTIELAFIRGDFANGRDSGIIDLVIVGKNISVSELERVKNKTERLINRKISVLNLSPAEYKKLIPHFSEEQCLQLFEARKK